MKRFLSLLAVLPITLSVVALAAAQEQQPGTPPPPPPAPAPDCVYCLTPPSGYCWADYGVAGGCTPIGNYPHCTYAQAYDYCAGWPAATHLDRDGLPRDPVSPVPVTYCALCVVGSDLCWANYGAPCTPPLGASQCTYSQAYSHCLGWAEATGYGPNGPPNVN